MRLCLKCREDKPLEAFNKDSHGRGGLHSYCRKCSNAASHDWEQANPEIVRDRKRAWAIAHPYVRDSSWHREYKLKSLYGLSMENYKELLEKQGGVCAICGTPPNSKPLYVDHDHASGGVRWLLCRNCNLGIGFLKDNPQLLRKAADMLEAVDG